MVNRFMVATSFRYAEWLISCVQLSDNGSRRGDVDGPRLGRGHDEGRGRRARTDERPIDVASGELNPIGVLDTVMPVLPKQVEGTGWGRRAGPTVARHVCC